MTDLETKLEALAKDLETMKYSDSLPIHNQMVRTSHEVAANIRALIASAREEPGLREALKRQRAIFAENRHRSYSGNQVASVIDAVLARSPRAPA